MTPSGLLASSVLLSALTVVPASGGVPFVAPPGVLAAAVCVAPAAAEYYAFPLASTDAIPGTGLAKGLAEVAFETASPFSVALTSDGSYHREVRVSLERLKAPARGRLVAWVTTREIDQVRRLGALDANFRAAGPVAWNKFLVVITLEPDDDRDAEMWTGPIVFRGMSVSGRMHTMVGHGALQQENCAAYGYGS